MLAAVAQSKKSRRRLQLPASICLVSSATQSGVTRRAAKQDQDALIMIVGESFAAIKYPGVSYRSMRPRPKGRPKTPRTQSRFRAWLGHPPTGLIPTGRAVQLPSSSAVQPERGQQASNRRVRSAYCLRASGVSRSGSTVIETKSISFRAPIPGPLYLHHQGGQDRAGVRTGGVGEGEASVTLTTIRPAFWV